MDISRFKYYVNVSCFLEVTELSVDTGRCYWDPLNAYVEFPEGDEAERETLADMLENDDTLFTIPGYEELFDLKSVCRIEDAPYWIRLKCIGNSIKDAVGLKEITSWEEYDELHAKITTERNDDGSVTFSVPKLQVARIKEDAVPVFVSHGDEPGERGEQGGVDDILVLTDKVDVLRVGPFRYYSKDIEIKHNDKFRSFVKYCQSLPVPRKILFRMEKDSQDVYMIESLRVECGRGFITVQYIGNICNFKIVDDMPKKKGQLPVVVDLYKELDLVKLFKNMNGEFTIEVKCNDKMEVFNRKYAECKPVFEALTLEGSKYFTIKCKGHEIIDTAFWTLEELNPTEVGAAFNERVTQELVYERLLKDYSGEPKLVGKLCSSKDSAPTTRRINSVKLNKVTRL